MLRLVAAWALTGLCWASGAILLRVAYREWRVYHRIAQVEVRPGGVEQTLPALQGAGREYRLVIRGAVRSRESGTIYDAVEAHSGGSAWTHGALEISPPDLAPTEQFKAPHKQVYVLRDGTDADGLPVRLRLNPTLLSDAYGVYDRHEPGWEGALRAELWERDGTAQGRWAVCLLLAGLTCAGWGAVRLWMQRPRWRRRRLPARNSEVGRLLHAIFQARREALEALEREPVAGAAGLPRRVEALASAAEEMALAAEAWSTVDGEAHGTPGAAELPASQIYEEYLRRLREIHALLVLLPTRLSNREDVTTTADALVQDLREELARYDPAARRELEEPAVQQMRAG